MKKLQVTKVLFGAFYVPWALRKSLAKALAGLIAVGVVLMMLWDQAAKVAPPIYIIILLLFGLVYVLFAVICHRMVLLGGASVPEYGVSGVSGRELRFALGILKVVFAAFLGWAFLYVIIIQFPVWIIHALHGDGSGDSGKFKDQLGWVMYLVQFYFFARFSLILPAIAVDGQPTLKWAWQISRGNGLRLMLVLGLLPLLVQLPFYLLPDIPGLPGSIIGTLLWWLMLPFEITALSLSYKELAEESA